MVQHYDFSEHTAQIIDDEICNLVKSNEKENTMDTFVSGLQSSIIHALMITGFVAMMMVLIEYLNILSRGIWQRGLRSNRWKQYLLASFLGAYAG